MKKIRGRYRRNFP